MYHLLMLVRRQLELAQRSVLNYVHRLHSYITVEYPVCDIPSR